MTYLQIISWEWLFSSNQSNSTMRNCQILHILRRLSRSHWVQSGKIGGKFLGNLNDTFLCGQLMLIAKNVLQIDVVFIQKCLHSWPILRWQSDTQWWKNICHNLAKYQVDGQGWLNSFRRRKHFFSYLQCPGNPKNESNTVFI